MSELLPWTRIDPCTHERLPSLPSLLFRHFRPIRVNHPPPPPIETPRTPETILAWVTPSLWRRMACWIYEGLLLFGVVFIASLLFTVLAHGVKSLWASWAGLGDPNLPATSSAIDLSNVTAASSALPSNLERELLQLFILSVLVAYFVYFWRKGQTLAMKTWGLELTTREGQRLSTAQALQRLVLSWVWFWPPLLVLIPYEWSWPERSGLALLWVAFWGWLSLLQPQKQFWHDAWARTQLVHKPPPQSKPQDSTSSR